MISSSSRAIGIPPTGWHFPIPSRWVLSRTGRGWQCGRGRSPPSWRPVPACSCSAPRPGSGGGAARSHSPMKFLTWTALLAAAAACSVAVRGTLCPARPRRRKPIFLRSPARLPPAMANVQVYWDSGGGFHEDVHRPGLPCSRATRLRLYRLDIPLPARHLPAPCGSIRSTRDATVTIAGARVVDEAGRTLLALPGGATSRP